MNAHGEESELELPPDYEAGSERAPAEYFEVEDTPNDENQSQHLLSSETPNGSRRWLTSMKNIGKQSISVPVRYLIDPVTNLWNGISMWLDARLSRFVNPLIAKRFFVIFASCIIIVLVRFKYTSSFRSTANLRDHSKLREILKNSIELKHLEETTDYFGKMPHYAGSLADGSTSNYVHDFFESLGLPSSYDRHQVFLSHGNSSICELKHNNEVVWSSTMQEGQALKDPTLSQKQPITQMALSIHGEGEGQLVYANFGSEDDLNAVDCKDRIVLVKYSQENPSAVSIRVQNHGAKGVLFMSAKHPSEPSWPEGSDYPADAIQQGTLAEAWRYPGDLLSPGWPSTLQMTIPISEAYIAHIPAAAISWNDAEHLLLSLKGHGTRMDNNSLVWCNNGAPEKVTEWWTGPNPEYTVRLAIQPITENRHEIRNVFGHLKGKEMDNRAIIVGARLDSVCYGSSQLSGLNVMLETARIFSDLKYTEQWEPLRAIYFSAWDGTSLNYAGITEWVENVADNLSMVGVVYIDLDLGISGPKFVVQGNPLIETSDLLRKVVYDDKSLWDAVDQSKSFRPIPGFGNHVALEAHAGVPSIRLGFQDTNKPVPVDSCYDNFEWMSKFGDPGHQRHLVLTEFLAYLILELSDAPVLPFDFVNLGREVEKYVAALEVEAKKTFNYYGHDIDMRSAVENAKKAAANLKDSGELYEQVQQQWNVFATENRDPTTGELPEISQLTRIRMYWNEKVAQASKFVLDRNGIASRNWYKNHLFGPEIDTSKTDELTGSFPAVRDALKIKSREAFIETLNGATTHIRQMTEYLSEMLV